VAYFQVEKLVKYFGGLAAVNGVSFRVEQGEILGLIGPNGSGKTTTFNMISGYHRPTSGRVLFKGQEIHRLPTHRICRLGIGRTFQVVKPLGRMSVLDNVIAAAYSRVGSHKEAHEHALETIRFCGMMPVKDQLAKSLPIAGRKRA
jgi:branched-chain amino acid transport system ATP-binding protein